MRTDFIDQLHSTETNIFNPDVVFVEPDCWFLLRLSKFEKIMLPKVILHQGYGTRQSLILKALNLTREYPWSYTNKVPPPLSLYNRSKVRAIFKYLTFELYCFMSLLMKRFYDPMHRRIQKSYRL